jgi:hypothetical protein
MNEMTERAARAIFKGKWQDGFGSDGLDPDELSFNGTPNWKQYEEDARLAIESLRIPTDAMLQEGIARLDRALDKSEAGCVYLAMIDKALK